MKKQQKPAKKFSLKFSLILAFILTLTLLISNSPQAIAARSGGRMGGGSFRSTPSAPSSRGGGGDFSRGGGFSGGGIGFPLILPFIGGGGGGLFTMLIFFAIVSFLFRAFQNAGFSGGDSSITQATTATVAQIQVGLLSSARELQQDLDRLALETDASTPEGRAIICQEVSLALLRHPEYWVYATADSSTANLDQCEAIFNKLSLTERSKFTEETLSNYNNQISRTDNPDKFNDNTGNDDYIIVTLLIGTTNNLKLSQVNSSEELRKTLQLIGGLSGDRLLVIEVLWSPQAKGDTLSKDDIITYYPDLRLL